MADAAEYKLISTDDHLDLGYLPRDVWTRRLPAKYAERAPHIEERDGRGQWISDGKVWGGWHGIKVTSNAPPPYLTALNRGGHWDPSEMRPGNLRLRLEDMDRDGVYIQSLFGPITSILADDAEFRDACHRAYNDWLDEFIADSPAPERFLGVPMLPWGPEAATAELTRLAKAGRFKQANLQLNGAEPRISDPAWESFWNALEETGMILSFHVAAFAGRPPRPDPATGTYAGTFSITKNFVGAFLDPFVDLFAWGILERHPKVRIVLAECGTGWLPWVIEELDYRHWRLWEAKDFWADKGGIPLREKPSDVFRRQIYPTFQEDHAAMALVKFYGEDNLMWGSDYPHPDSVWPDSRGAIERQMHDFPPALKKKITHDNAARLYGLNV